MLKLSLFEGEQKHSFCVSL